MRYGMTRVGPLALLIAATGVTSLVDGRFASAEPGKRTTRRATPAGPANTALDVIWSVKSPKPAPVTPVLKNDDDTPLKPFDLPAAPRARMRQCGESWQKIKLSGEAGDRTWREFATVCLTERSASSPSASPQNTNSTASR